MDTKNLQCIWCRAKELWVAEVVGTHCANVNEVGQAVVSPLYSPMATVQVIVSSQFFFTYWLKKTRWHFLKDLKIYVLIQLILSVNTDMYNLFWREGLQPYRCPLKHREVAPLHRAGKW